MASNSNAPQIHDSLSHIETQISTTSTTAMQHYQQQMHQTQRVCLETSFTNLHSPLLNHKYPHFSESVSSSKASSLADSILSRSQISCIQYDISSAVENSISTVARKSPISATLNEAKIEQVELVLQLPKSKCVAFEDMPSPFRNVKRHNSTKEDKKPKSLPIPPLRRASDITNGGNATDEWLGLAPLASPETLSEISSISSRNSVRNGLGTAIDDHYLHNITYANNNNNNAIDINDIFESQLHTPTVLRRAPKFIENLSNCAEDSRNIDQYKRMGRVIVPPPLFLPKPQDSSDDDDSFASANSYKKATTTNNTTSTNGDSDHIQACHRRQNSKSADQLDDVVTTSNKIQQTIETNDRKLTFSDSNIINDNDISANTINSLCTKCPNSSSHCSCNHLDMQKSGSQDTTFYSANSSIDCMSAVISHTSIKSTSNSNTYIIPEGVLESHFPLHQDAFTNTTTTELYSKKYALYNDPGQTFLVQKQNMITYQSPKSTLSARGKRKNCIYPSTISTQQLYATPAVDSDNIKLYTSSSTNNNTTTTNIPDSTIVNGSSSPTPRSRTPNESSV